MSTPADRLRRARINRGIDSAYAAAEMFGWNENTYSSNENGNAPFSHKAALKYAKAFRVRAQWLEDGIGPMTEDAITVPVRGRVGADSSGEIVYSSADETGDQVPQPPGGGEKAVALEVNGHSMRGFADQGSLIYFEEQHTPPTADMLGQVVIVETEDGHVLLKRLLRGSEPHLYDLESLNGPTLTDQRLKWAAEITAIIPPKQARRIILRGSERAA